MRKTKNKLTLDAGKARIVVNVVIKLEVPSTTVLTWVSSAQWRFTLPLLTSTSSAMAAHRPPPATAKLSSATRICSMYSG